eukprot:COSAG02_NODE_1953_length_10277_cov_3.865003_4_plen_149_part_00
MLQTTAATVFIIPLIFVAPSACVRVVLSPQKMKSGRQILEELELHAQYKEKYEVSDDDTDPEVERLLLTQNSIRKYMEDRGMDPEQKRAEREERRERALASVTEGGVKKPQKASRNARDRTVVKIANPMQQEFDMDNFEDSSSDMDDE